VATVIVDITPIQAEMDVNILFRIEIYHIVAFAESDFLRINFWLPFNYGPNNNANLNNNTLNINFNNSRNENQAFAESDFPRNNMISYISISNYNTNLNNNTPNTNFNNSSNAYHGFKIFITSSNIPNTNRDSIGNVVFKAGKSNISFELRNSFRENIKVNRSNTNSSNTAEQTSHNTNRDGISNIAIKAEIEKLKSDFNKFQSTFNNVAERHDNYFVNLQDSINLTKKKFPIF